MARTVRNFKLDSRDARSKLTLGKEPYWVKITKGCYVGYRRGATTQVGNWIARYRDANGRQKYHALGPADDALDADGHVALSFAQAQEKARDWFHTAAATEHRGGRVGRYTVADCMADYLK